MGQLNEEESVSFLIQLRCVCLPGVVLGRNVSPGSIGFANLVNFLEGVIAELKVLKVRLFSGSSLALITSFICSGPYLDSRWSNRLGNNREALMGRPVDQDLRRLLIELLGNVNDLGLVNNSGFASGVVTERRVGGDDNVLLLALR